MRPPRNFFGGLANLLTRGHWGSPEAMETYNAAEHAYIHNHSGSRLLILDAEYLPTWEQIWAPCPGIRHEA